jgi:putative tryptophan/tyrosine transport system substrate-binding protein
VKRREFIMLVGGAAAAWPIAARAQQPGLPAVAFVSGGSRDMAAYRAAAFREALGEMGFIEGQNVMVEYRGVDGRFAELPSIMADLARRRMAVIAAPDSAAVALAAKAATTTIPIIFGVGEDPVRLGLVASLARPDGNVTGLNFFSNEVQTKRLGILHELVPKAVRVALLVNPGNAAVAEDTVRLSAAARPLGLDIRFIKAASAREIEAAFSTLAQERPDAIFVAADAFFNSRRVQFVTLAAHYSIPATYSNPDYVEVGGLMSYGTDIADRYRQVGIYAGRILKGAKPAELPVVQSTKFELAINLQTARLLRLEVPPSLLALADEVIE